MKFSSVRTQLLVPTLLVLSLGVLCLIFLTSNTQLNSDEISSTTQMRELARSESVDIVKLLDGALTTAQTLDKTIEAQLASMPLDRAILSASQAAILDVHPELLGVYVGFEPNFDDQDADCVGKDFCSEVGRYLNYAYREDGVVKTQHLPLTGAPTEQFWYTTPMQQGRQTVTPPYLDVVGNSKVMMVSVSMPVTMKGKAVGVVDIDLALNDVQKKISALNPMGGGWAGLISADNQWVAYPDEAQRGKPIEAGLFRDAMAQVKTGKTVETTYNDPITHQSSKLVVLPIRFGQAPEVWGYVVSVPQAIAMADAYSIRTSLIIQGIVVLIISALAVLLVGNSVARPIIRLTGSMTRLAQGDLNADIHGGARADEVGAMARAVQVFKDNALAMTQMKRREEEAKQTSEAERVQTRQTLASRFEQQVSGVVSDVGGASRDMEHAAQTMSSLAQQVSSQSASVAAASQQASANVQTVAAATEELSASVREISRQVAESNQIAKAAVREAAEADGIVQSLADSANRIGEIVNLITDIASQTNLLALNATIEAARAGDAGKGFAVVANEVKHLANQTAKATDEITGQIGAIQSETSKAADAIRSVGETIAQIDQISTAISSAVEEQAAATSEIARNVDEATRGTSLVSDNINHVTQAADQSGRAASEVLDVARKLKGNSTALEQAVGGFLSNVRAG